MQDFHVRADGAERDANTQKQIHRRSPQDDKCRIFTFEPTGQNVTKPGLTAVRVRRAGFPLVNIDVGVPVVLS